MFSKDSQKIANVHYNEKPPASAPPTSKPPTDLAEVEKRAERDLELLFLHPEPDARLRDIPPNVELQQLPDLPVRPSPSLPSRSVPAISSQPSAQRHRPPPKPAAKPLTLRSKSEQGSRNLPTTPELVEDPVSLRSRPKAVDKPLALRSPPIKEDIEEADVIIKIDEAQGLVKIRPTVSKSISEPWGKLTTKARLGADHLSVAAQSSTKLMRKKSADISAAIGTVTKPGAEGLQKGAAEAGEKLKPIGNAMGNVIYKTVGRPIEQVAKAIADDFSDNFIKLPFKNDYLCSQCRKFPSIQVLTSAPPQDRRIWVSPLRRLIWHGKGCRFCMFLLRALCRPRNDPFNHPQVRPFLRDSLSKQTFASWLSLGDASILLNSLWPFGEGERMKDHSNEGEGGGATRMIGSLGASTINAGMDIAEVFLKVLILEERSKRKPQQASTKVKPTIAKSIHLKEPLPCFVQICTSTSAQGVLDASLMGFGPGVPTLAALSSFRLRLEMPLAPVSQPSLRSAQVGLSYGCHVRWSQIDAEMCQSWLHHCETMHGAACHEPAWVRIKEKPSFLRVIDVHRLCLVDFSGNEVQQLRYVTLSYVWGSTNNIRLERTKKARWKQPKGLEREMSLLPKTILDAITVTRATGERYLWVDSLCICQDDMNEKLEQINMMDRVYGNALVTIIAADSVHADAGLQDVLPFSRNISQLTERINDDTKIMLPLQTPQSLATSPWNTRAWTMQERFLSRRLLIFVEGQMIWRCRQLVNYEDMPGEEKGLPSEVMTWLTIKPQYLGINARRGYVDGTIIQTSDGRTELVRSGTFTEYSKLIREYTHRQMTQASDILRALVGLLHILELSFKSPIIQGLPQALLDAAILWRPVGTLKRRTLTDEKIPSWCWAGWIGRVEYEQTYSDETNAEGNLTRKPQALAGPERFRPLLRWHTYSVNERKLLPINGHGLGIPWQPNAGEKLPEEWEKTPFFVSTYPIRLYEMPPETRSLLDEHHLVFRTSCTSHFVLGDQILAAPRTYKLVDSAYKHVGFVRLDGLEPEWIDGSRHEFIVVSEAQYYGYGPERGRAPKDYSGEYPLYNVMLVEWAAEWRVASRLGIGRVSKEAWKAAHPVAKVVVLG